MNISDKKEIKEWKIKESERTRIKKGKSLTLKMVYTTTYIIPTYQALTHHKNF